MVTAALEDKALAWEFLRRNPAYVADYRRLRAGCVAALPEHWGLAFPVDPGDGDIDPGAIWQAATPTFAAPAATPPATSPPKAGSAAGFPRASARR